MQNIISSVSDNSGGNEVFYFVPRRGVSSIPAELDLVITDDIVFQSGYSFYKCAAALESMALDIQQSRTPNGSGFDNTFTAFIPGDEDSFVAPLRDMAEDEFIVLRKDNDGTYKLIGSMEEPLRFEYKFQSGDSFASRKGYHLRFFRQGSIPEYFYQGAVVTADETDEQNIIPSGDDSTGGNENFWFIPVQYVTDIPAAIDIVVYDNIALSASSTFYIGSGVLESIVLEIPQSRTGHGSVFDINFTAFIAGDEVDHAANFREMAEQKFILIRKDNDGNYKLLGSLEEPLNFSYKFQSGDSYTSMKGFQIKFYVTGTIPEYFYQGIFETNTGDVLNTGEVEAIMVDFDYITPDTVDITITSNMEGTYSTIINKVNIDSISIKLNGVTADLPVTFVAGDTFTPTIVRTNALLDSSFQLMI